MIGILHTGLRHTRNGSTRNSLKLSDLLNPSPQTPILVQGFLHEPRPATGSRPQLLPSFSNGPHTAAAGVRLLQIRLSADSPILRWIDSPRKAAFDMTQTVHHLALSPRLNFGLPKELGFPRNKGWFHVSLRNTRSGHTQQREVTNPASQHQLHLFSQNHLLPWPGPFSKTLH